LGRPEVPDPLHLRGGETHTGHFVKLRLDEALDTLDGQGSIQQRCGHVVLQSMPIRRALIPSIRRDAIVSNALSR
jgi:hypothetical protein